MAESAKTGDTPATRAAIIIALRCVALRCVARVFIFFHSHFSLKINSLKKLHVRFVAEQKQAAEKHLIFNKNVLNIKILAAV